MGRRFQGDLNSINPKFLVNEEGYDRSEYFFIALAVVFNDLKGLILFDTLLREEYERSKKDEITSHAGNYGGVAIHIQKLIASTINEFFVFLKKNSDVFSMYEFREAYGRLSTSEKESWDALVAGAHGRLLPVRDFLKSIVQIRSNIGFHFDHSGKILRSAYISRFFGKTNDASTQWAYYSIGDSIALTRFYFADAAMEEALHVAAGKKLKEKSTGDISLEKYNEQVLDTIRVISRTLSALMKCYLQSRRNRPHP